MVLSGRTCLFSAFQRVQSTTGRSLRAANVWRSCNGRLDAAGIKGSLREKRRHQGRRRKASASLLEEDRGSLNAASLSKQQPANKRGGARRPPVQTSVSTAKVRSVLTEAEADLRSGLTALPFTIKRLFV